MLRVINAEDRRVADAVAREIPAIARAVDAIAAAFERGGRLFYIGAGTSGRLGVLDASECPPTFGADPGHGAGHHRGRRGRPQPRHRGHRGRSRPGRARPGRRAASPPRDVLVGIAASGRTPYVLGAVAHARAPGRASLSASVARPIPSWRAPWISPSRRWWVPRWWPVPRA